MRIEMKFCLIAFMFAGLHLWGSSGNSVVLKRSGDKWQLLLNRKKYAIKGVGVGYQYGKKGEDYLKMASSLGANTVRTWGVDQGTKAYLDAADKLNLKVCAGIWLNPIAPSGRCSYITDRKYRRKVRKEALQYVRRFKDHPAVLFWNLGNEVFHFTKHSEKERVAFARFLNKLAGEIKKIDPYHPIVYTSSALAGHRYIVQYVPNIDIFGINLYGGVANAIYLAENLNVNGKKLNRPVLVTELGPNGPWDSRKDSITGLPIEASDQTKAMLLRSRVKFIIKQSSALGVFAFHLGETTQESMTWWNINYKKWHLQSFRSLQSLYKKQKPVVRTPVISSMDVDRRSVTPGSWISVRVTAYSSKRYPRLLYTYFCSSARLKVMLYYVNQKINARIKGSGARVRVQVPQKPGLYRLYVLVTNGSKNAAVANVPIQVESY